MDSKKKTLIIVLAVIVFLAIAAYSFFAGNYNKFVSWIRQLKVHGHRWKINCSGVMI